ncbi:MULTISPECIES: DUF3606 domain-containing protein [unclassified Polaromonas]|uniref:DUF3606 domain-containing protein n=1 Tax=unclassified Polaromonas TaxID=2638319 RepID=UPI000F0789E8|nr:MULTISPECIES: DUF3606 domain-containing protein [unclassified Polaromonas]AYQ29241.1 DUF3606 domain-containing protein [Polaromonas sp. SP1]QGJ19645.1 DUF3606 domain-containing protein [Polaromonas sp. Pch-P]
MTHAHPPAGVQPERINLNDKASTDTWTQKLSATREQLREAIAAVGDKAADVEMHLKGSHSTTNSDRVEALSPNKPAWIVHHPK